MSKEERQISLRDVQVVQNLIEWCLQLYMSQSEVVSRLLDHAKIEPGFTEQVWQSLEAENQEFFRAYHLRLMVKDQILRFNQLLERQVELTRHISQTGAVSVPVSNGSHIPSTYRAPEPSGPFMKTEDMRQVISAIPNIYANSMPSVRPSMLVNVVGHGGRVDMPSNMPLAQTSNVGTMHGFNSAMVKAEGSYSGNSPVMFSANNNLLEPRSGIGGASISTTLNSGDLDGRTLHATVLDLGTNSFGFPGQIMQNFSFSDLPADFSNGAGILDNYSRSPLLGMDTSFLDLRDRAGQQDIEGLDATSGEFSYKDFGSIE